MEIVSIKKNCSCDKCSKDIKEKSKCFVDLRKSKGGPFLRILCLKCGSGDMTLIDKVIADYNNKGIKTDKTFITTYNCPDMYFKHIKPIEGCHKALGTGNGILCKKCWERKEYEEVIEECLSDMA